MFYCESCMLLTSEEERCPGCGRKKLRLAQPGDAVYLTEKLGIEIGILAECLKDNDIPFLQRSMMGAGISSQIGTGRDVAQFFVPYGKLAAAKEIVEELFTPVEPELDEG